jgi:hypothetical protein
LEGGGGGGGGAVEGRRNIAVCADYTAGNGEFRYFQLFGLLVVLVLHGIVKEECAVRRKHKTDLLLSELESEGLLRQPRARRRHDNELRVL